MDYPKVAEEAINLFLEYRDVHGYTNEDEAKAKAVYEFQEYQNLCVNDNQAVEVGISEKCKMCNTLTLLGIHSYCYECGRKLKST